MRRHPLILAYIAALIPALVMAVTQPVWSLVDEAQHADFIDQLSRGVYPVADMTLIDSATLHATESTGVFRAFYPPGSYPTPDLTDIGLPPAGMTARANAAWMQRHGWQLSLESVQTPAYYVSMVPVWWAADRLGGPFAAIYAVRVINALMVAALAPMAVAVAWILFPSRREIAVLAAMLAILLPGLDLNGTRISNDALAAAIGGLLVLLAVRWAGSEWSWRRTALMGLILGAGLMAKITLVGLAPALAVSALWPVAGTTWRGRIVRVAVIGTIAAVCLAPWFFVNIHDYGTALRSARVTRLSDAVPGHLTGSFIALDVAVFVLTYWTGEPWGVLPLAAVLAVFGGLIALTAPIGLIKTLRTRAVPGSMAPLAVAIAAAMGMIAIALLLPASSSFEFVGAGRYAYPALPAAAALCAIGICTVLAKASAQRLVGAAYAAVAVAMLAAGAAGLPAPSQPGTRTPPPDARVVNVTADGRLQGMTVSIDRVAFDATARATWFEVRVSNSGPDEAEWTVPPVVSSGGVVATGEYLKSSQLPGDIEAGQAVSGWLFVPLDPALIHAGNSLHLRFADVAVNDYGTVGDINLDLPLSGLSG